MIDLIWSATIAAHALTLIAWGFAALKERR